MNVPKDIDLDSVMEWVVNEYGELGIKIGDRIGYLYKGYFIEYTPEIRGTDEAPRWRHVYKREFGEVCHGHGWWDRRTGQLSEWARDFKNSDSPENPWQDNPNSK